MSPRWYFTRDGKTYGPYSQAEVKRLAVEGKITPSDVLWPEGTEPQVELVPLATPVVVPPPPPGLTPDWLKDVAQAEQLRASGPPKVPPAAAPPSQELEPTKKPGVPDWLEDVRREQRP